RRGLSSCSRPASASRRAWPHAGHIKLPRSLAEGAVSDMPPQPVQRYQRDKVKPRRRGWRGNNKCSRLSAGLDLRIELREPSIIHWTDDGWATVRDNETWDSGLGLHLCDLPTANLHPGQRVIFTILDLRAKRWAEIDYEV